MMEAPDLLQWSAWRPLRNLSQDPAVPPAPGLYRIRRVGRHDLDYIGQTGRSLAQRLRMLVRGIVAEEMPYRGPHTAAPALWALRHATGCDFEVSVALVEGSAQWRKGQEALAIALYRQEQGRSPTVEFGRMPAGYRMSSSNNAQVVQAGKRFRGGPTLETDASHSLGISPIGPLSGHPQGSAWGGHQWSAWVPSSEVQQLPARGAKGLYRLRGADPERLLYIGQGHVRSRLRTHIAKRQDLDHVQGQTFATGGRIECSWVLNDEWLSHHRLELENDLIAAHLVATGDLPVAQFLG
jgi:hypothetical protein